MGLSVPSTLCASIPACGPQTEIHAKHEHTTTGRFSNPRIDFVHLMLTSPLRYGDLLITNV